jgi:hypothetical protein
MLVGGVAALVGAVIAFVWLPARAAGMGDLDEIIALDATVAAEAAAAAEAAHAATPD